MVELQINQIKMLLIAIYAPNEKQNKFFRKLYEDEVIRNYDHLCLMGFFNAIVDKRKDYKKTHKRKSKKKIFPKTFFQLTEELGLEDAWRERNGEKNNTLTIQRHTKHGQG